MKDNLFVSLIFAVLTLATGALFWYGERIIHVKAGTGYTVLSFNSANDRIFKEKEEYGALAFSIRDFGPETGEYEITTFINDVKVESFKKTISKDAVLFEPSQKIKKQLSALGVHELLEYKITASRDGWEEFISKKVRIDE